MRLQKGFSIANIFGVLLGLLSVSAILGAYYFIHQSRDNRFEQNIATLNTLQQLDAKWSAAILKTRSYTLQDFDQLAFYMIKIRDGLGVLDRQGMLDIESVGEKTVNQYQVYKYSFKTKNEAVEHYKSQQAILRNSVRYLPTTSNALQHVLVEKNTKKSQELNSVVVTSNLLVNQFLFSAVDAGVIREKLIELDLQLANEDEETQEKIQDYLTHVRLIIKHRPKVSQMLQTAMATDIGDLSAKVIYEYTQTQNSVKQRIKRLQEIMLAGGVMLLAVLLWFLFRLRNSNQKVMTADAESEATHQQLLQAEEQITEVNKNILQTEQRAASGQLAIGSFKHLQTTMPAFSEHLAFLNEIKTEQTLVQYGNQLKALTTDITDLQHNITVLNTLIDPQTNHNKQIDFDFNYIVRKALDVASFEAGSSIVFTEQLSDIPVIQASPLDIFQVILKLFRQAVISAQLGDKKIFFKTCATGRYANMYMTLSGHNDLETLYAKEGLAVVRELIEKNQGVLKLTPREDDSIGMVWVSFPYTQLAQ
jgi:hypothetical protein